MFISKYLAMRVLDYKFVKQWQLELLRIASNVASLPEVIGNAGYLIPLGDSATLADKLLLLLTKQIEVQRLAKLAQQQAAQFSWDKCAMKTWNVIEQVIKNNR